MKYRKETGLTYLNNLDHVWYANDATDLPMLHTLLSQFKVSSPMLASCEPVLFIIDYSRRQYLLMTESLIDLSGYHPKEFLEAGLDKLLDVFHRDDFTVFNNSIFKVNTAFLNATPQELHHQHIFSYNFRFTGSDKQDISVLQKCRYITSPATGLPLFSIGIITDITDYKTDTTIVHSITRHEPGMKTRLMEKNFFYPNQEDTLLTPREKDVLSYIADGLSSKEIAAVLKLSDNTIENHRQNMMRKTNTKNIAALVAFAIRNRII